MSNITGREYIYGIAQDKNGAPYLFNMGEIVRCKDCIYWRTSYCTEHDGTWIETDYCSDGERREDGE